MKLLRPIAPLAVALVSVAAFAQEKAVEAVEAEKDSTSFMDNVSAISREWWLVTLVITLLLSAVIGYFVYKSKVNSGQARGATGCGCGIALGIWFLLQLLAICILAYTLFGAADRARAAEEAKKKDAPKTETPANDKPGTQPPTTGGTTGKTSTTGDDF